MLGLWTVLLPLWRHFEKRSCSRCESDLGLFLTLTLRWTLMIWEPVSNGTLTASFRPALRSITIVHSYPSRVSDKEEKYALFEQQQQKFRKCYLKETWWTKCQGGLRHVMGRHGNDNHESPHNWPANQPSECACHADVHISHEEECPQRLHPANESIVSCCRWFLHIDFSWVRVRLHWAMVSLLKHPN